MYAHHFILLLIGLIYSIVLSDPTLVQKEYEALEDLYNSTKGISWSWLNVDEHGPIWFNGTYPCATPNWQGITCVCYTDCNILEIFLPFYNMTGTLPESIGNFTELTLFDLNSNFLNGTLPSSLGGLSKLRDLYFYSNFLTGSIPIEFYEASSLSQIFLFNNYLNGTLSPAISNLLNLNLLDLNNNQLSGSIPSALANLPLVYLSLTANYINGSIPADLFGPTSQLEQFEVTENLITGILPREMCAVTSLTVFEVSVNSIEGTIPSCIGQLENLVTLSLSMNPLNGSLPEGLYNLTQLQALEIATNDFTGTLSDKIGQWTKMTSLTLSLSNIGGTLPSSMGQMTSLNFLLLSSNNFDGPLPSALFGINTLELLYLDDNQLTGQLISDVNLGTDSKLSEIVLSYNSLNGTLPPTLCSLNYLVGLYLNDNLFTGTIPECLYDLRSVEGFYLFNNLLEGTISNAITHMKNLVDLDVGGNYLGGTIPSNIGLLRNLSIVDVDTNEINGSIPLSLWYSTSLTELTVYNNLITGSIPDSFTNASVLEALDAYNNFITGTLPASLCNASQWSTIVVQSNYMHGSLLDCFWSITSLTEFSVSDNSFTGTVSANLTLLNKLTDFILSENSFSGFVPRYTANSVFALYLNNNLFTGTIPEGLYTPGLRSFCLYSNFLSGTISESVKKLLTVSDFDVSTNLISGTIPNLIPLMFLGYFSIHDNIIEGSLTDCFDANSQYLEIIFLSSNQLTGPLPAAAFGPVLQSFSAVSNCLTGSIPEEICGATQLISLALDGLHTASNCRHSLLPLVSNSYGLDYYTPGSIPPCLFNMTHLSTLHVSGNGIGGSLPSDLVLGPSLVNLTLSYNQLTGNIPAAISQRAFDNIELSFNRLGGVLSISGTTAINSTVDYNVNRLSGKIPSVLKNVQSISILDGNHFSCDTDRQQLPVHDEQYSYYECGTSTLQQSIYAWVGLLGFGVVVSAYVTIGSLRMSCFKNVQHSLQVMNDNVQEWRRLFTKDDSNPLNIQRVGTFMSQLRRSSLFVTTYVVLVLVPVNVALSHYYDMYQYQYAWSVGSVYLTGLTAAVALFVVFLFFLIWFFGVLYVTVETKLDVGTMFENDQSADKSRQHHYGLLINLLLIAVGNFAVVLAVNIGYVVVATRYNPTIVAITQIAIATYKLVWNDLVIRNLVSESHSFWLNHFHIKLSSAEKRLWSGRHMTFNTYLMIVNVIVIPCLATAAVSSDCFYDVLKQPGKVYSSFSFDACVSSVEELCTSFTLVTTQTSYLPPYLYRYQCSSTLVTTYAILYVYNFMILSFAQPLLVAALTWYSRRINAESHTYKLLVAAGVVVTDVHRLFDKDRMNLRMIMYLAIFVTFGVIFPPLAVIICVTVLIQTYWSELWLGHWVSECGAARAETRRAALQALSDACGNAGVMFMQTVYVVGPCAAFFYAYTVYDTYADAGGGFSAVWLSCSLFVIGCGLSVGFKLLVDWKFRKEERDSNFRVSKIEMRTTSLANEGSNPLHF